MKKFFSSFLALAFLLPAVASAGSYCVSFPTGGESKWSKRDNSINVRFRYDYERKYKGAKYAPAFWTATGVPKGSGKKSSPKDGYTSYRYGATDLCMDDPAPRFGSVDYVKAAGLGLSGSFSPAPTKVRLDVKWGGDCGTVGINRYGRFAPKGDHKFEIYRRKGNHIDPFGCRRKK